MVRYFLALFLALALSVTFACRETFFVTPAYEEGDDAANALQIHRAKEFRELHGNYSRWEFHHPGPAFFYAYALGEWLLCDVTHLAPAPHNAHVYTGTLLQLAFYAAAIALLARHSRRPLLAIALALAVGAWHYAHVDRVLYSVWPPDVLLMPFLFFTIACTAVAIGDRTALPLMVLGGGFLVHGHIAQPLFVVPMSLAALGLALRRWRGEISDVIRSRATAVALVLLGVFLLPLVVDLFAGNASNAHDVLLHLKYQTDGGKSLFKSLLCYASYFVGMNDPTMFNKLDANTHVPFTEHAWLLATWVIVLLVSTWLLFRKKASEPAADDQSFGRRLILFWLLGSALTLVWGMRQDGGFTNFNSHFNHSLVYLVALIGVVALASVLPAVSRGFGWCLALAATPLLVLAVPAYPDDFTRGDDVEVRVTALLQADPKPNAPKLITWEVPDADWYESTTLGRAFQRRGIEFYVQSGWGFMFGNDKVFANQRDVLSHGGVSVWHVTQRNVAPRGAHVLNHGYALVFPAPAAVPTLPVTIDFTNGTHAPYTLAGIERQPTDHSTWTYAQVAALTFNAPNTAHDLELTLDALGFVSTANPAGQRVTITVNGQRIGETTFNETRRTARFRVPAETWNRTTPRMIVFDLPDAVAPSALGQSADRRLLGLQLYRLSVTSAP